MQTSKTVLILGANSDVAKEAMKLYVQAGFSVIAASRSTDALEEFIQKEKLDTDKVSVLYFDAEAFDTHAAFYASLAIKPNIVVYAAGYLKHNEEALLDWEGSFRMMKVHYAGAVSILNIIAMDKGNTGLERIIGLSSLSGVRGEKAILFMAAPSRRLHNTWLACGSIFSRHIKVNVIVAGYIRSKMTQGLNLPESLMLEPSYIARAVVNAGNKFIIVPGIKWKMIYQVLKAMPEKLVARLP